MATEIAHDVMARLRAHQITTIDEIHAANGEPHPSIVEKEAPRLSPLAIEFIQKSPYFLVGTSDAAGNCDVSPKGDEPGFVRVLDDSTLAIPDRLGNRRADGHRNILENGHVGLIFIVPAVDETLRVNGRAFLTRDPELLETMANRGKAPHLATIIEIDQVFMHCARSILRAGLWKPEMWPDPDTIPTMHAISCELKDMPLPDESGGKRQEEYRERLY
ncbi:MAG TPA: MSMEG_1061 family FMN-dependent PPOX-type flavoprotein [Thermomicrobiales bacterium]|nr:MSMEG_1061 family FMN-dependent PPOX-type flavoprotein [Thermomicrobiales bacterium]